MRLVLFCLLLFTVHRASAQLMINEISQGTGSQEYVEFVVMGTPTCQTPVPCVDLRGIVIDDNNGYFAAGSGTGIATGAIQFANDSFWSCVPQGTIIVVYSDTDPNSALPPDDLSLNDGNCLLVIPVNSVLFNGQGLAPTSSDANYPAQGSWVNAGGTWGQIAMSNTNDSFQIRQTITSATPNYSVSWGNNTTNAQISFGTAGGAVFSFTNQTSNDPLNQSNWAQGAVGANETPGVPNTPENMAWIASMNPSCYGAPGLQITLTPSPTACGSNCTGAITSSVSGGAAPYTYDWNTGDTGPDISNQCAGMYFLTVTDNLGCSATETATITQNSNLNPQALVSNETCQGECDGAIAASAMGGTSPYSYNWSNSFNGQHNQNLCPGTYVLTVTDQNGCTATLDITVGVGNAVPNSALPDLGTHDINNGTILIPTQSNGGTWTSSCGTCIAQNGVFDPQVSGVGTFEVCYTTSNGNCSSTSCDSIVITQNNGCVDVTSSVSFIWCEGDTVTVNFTDYTAPGTYIQQFLLPDGCDSTLYITLASCMNGTDVLEIPNVFTPNNDGSNDLWEVKTLGLNFESGYIYNRWGEVILTFVDFPIAWDGKINQVDATEGVYFYSLNFMSDTTPVFNKQGFIQLFR